jgi:hypothetical protein
MPEAIPAPFDAAPTGPQPPATARPPGWQSRLFLLVICAGAFALFWWAGGALGVSRERGFNGSLLVSPGPAGNLLVTCVLTFAAVVLGTVVAGFVRPDAGLLGAALGLVALSVRGQPVYAVLHDADGGRGAYLLMALELVLLYAFLGAAWWMLFALQRRGRLHRDTVRDGLPDVDLPANAGWTALMTHVLIMAGVVILVAQSEDKKQVLAAVAIGAFAGAFFPYWQHGARPSAWYWAGPLAVGVAGYVLAWVNPPLGTDIGRPGHPAGFLAALARPLPLDYAGAGTAGALLGYWMRRRSLRDRQTP